MRQRIAEKLQAEALNLLIFGLEGDSTDGWINPRLLADKLEIIAFELVNGVEVA